jgi:hypothetical protein
MKINGCGTQYQGHQHGVHGWTPKVPPTPDKATVGLMFTTQNPVTCQSVICQIRARVTDNYTERISCTPGVDIIDTQPELKMRHTQFYVLFPFSTTKKKKPPLRSQRQRRSGFVNGGMLSRQQECTGAPHSTMPCYMGYLITLELRQHSRYSDWIRAGGPRSRSSSPGRVRNFQFFLLYRPAVWHSRHPIQSVSAAFPEV